MGRGRGGGLKGCVRVCEMGIRREKRRRGVLKMMVRDERV